MPLNENRNLPPAPLDPESDPVMPPCPTPAATPALAPPSTSFGVIIDILFEVNGWKINTQGYAGGPAKILLSGGLVVLPTLAVREHVSV